MTNITKFTLFLIEQGLNVLSTKEIIIDELKQRKAKEETNLIIRNGVISQRQPHVSKNAEATNTQQTNNCS